MLMKHLGETPIKIKGELLEHPPKGEKWVTIEPGEEVECKEGYCRPLLAANGSRVPCVVERTAPGLVPADEEYRTGEWAEAPEVEWSPPSAKLSASQLRGMGVSPGVAEIMEKRAQADLKEELAAQPSQRSGPPRAASRAETVPVPGPLSEPKEPVLHAPPVEDLTPEPKAATEKKGRGGKK